jgi:hypothetical protein
MASIAFASLKKVIELVNGVQSSEDMYLRVVSSNRLAVGTDPLNPTHIIDIAREAVMACNGVEAPSRATVEAPSRAKVQDSAPTDAKGSA